jgi:hypothetical protein
MRRLTHRITLSVLLGLGGLVGPRLLAAERPEHIQTAVQKLLTVGWQVAREARQQADDYYGRLAGSVQAEPRVQQAYLLVLLKQQRYTEVPNQVDDILRRERQDLLAWRAKIWLAMLTKKYGVALVDIDKLGASWPAATEQGARADEYQGCARFLGALFGFLEAPAAPALSAAQRDAALKKFVARLDPPSQEAFEAGRREAKQQYAALLADQGEADEAAKRKADEEREDVLKDVATAREGVDQRRESVAEEANRARDEYQAQKQKLAQAEAPLQTDLARLQAQAAFPQGELARLRGEMARLEDLARREKDPVQRDRLRAEIARLDIRGDRYRAQLLELERAAALLTARLVEVQRERARVELEAGGRMTRVERELGDLNRREQQADAAERKARETTGDKRRARAIATRVAALTTYAPFPLEEEKQKLLAAPAAKP